ncbi:hypothetical protein Bxe_C1240 [Paraburkholderia xenovorans LB400]|uniref:Uncharacterized protein n=1 Tax=Paraburkholderia xenovorans (strain LB400) TaxID=266265 RepID=Q13FN9_PARXL|nr:hypothetical protein Bxe_C1240 [Paraburkholderia xenovorans LB400]
MSTGCLLNWRAGSAIWARCYALISHCGDDVIKYVSDYYLCTRIARPDLNPSAGATFPALPRSLASARTVSSMTAGLFFFICFIMKT